MSVSLSEKIQVMFDPRLVKRIDDWRFANRIASRSDAVRQLIAIGLNEKNGAAEAATSPRHGPTNPPQEKANEHARS